MHRSVIEKLDAIPLTDLFRLYKIDWQEGRNFKCPFPNHGATGNTPSFRFYKDTNSCSCFGCHKGGGPIHFVMNMENISYVEACDKLMSLFNIDDIPKFTYQKVADKYAKRAEERNEKLKFGVLSDILSMLDYTSDSDLKKFSFLYLMLNSYSADDYLSLSIDALSMSLEEFVLKVPQQIKDNQRTGIYIIKHLCRHSFEQMRSFDPIQIHSGYFSESTGIIWQTQNNRYVFPIFLPGKVLVGFSGRTLNPNETLKYQTELFSQLTKKDVAYGLDVAIPYIKEKGYCIIVEGILDAVRCWSVGYKNTIAPCCSYVSENLALLLKGLTSNFILLQDNDYGGESEANLSYKCLKQYGLNARRLLLPSNADPDSFGLENPAGLAELLNFSFS